MDPPTSPDAALGVHWVGHATMLVQLGELVVLTDPVFTETVGGLSRRLVAASLTSESLPPIDVALVSHRHFDHLSIDSLEAIAPKLRALVVPKGAEHDVPALPVPIHALGWNAGHTFGALEVTAVPVAHTSDRLLFDADSHPEAYAGYVLRHRGVTVFFAGDTAFDERVFRAVRERFGPIDLALLPIGPIAPREVMAPPTSTRPKRCGRWRCSRRSSSSRCTSAPSSTPMMAKATASVRSTPRWRTPTSRAVRFASPSASGER